MAEQVETGKQQPRRRRVWAAILALVLALLLFLSLFITDAVRIKLRKDAESDAEKTAVEALAENSAYINASASERVSMWLQTVLSSPETYEDYYQIATILIAQGAYERALANIDKSIERYDGGDRAVTDELYMKRGGLFAMLGRYEEMEESFAHVSEESGYHAQKLLLIAQAAIEQNDADKAVTYLEAYIDCAPDDVQMHMVLAQIYIAMENYEGAVSAYSGLLDRYDDSSTGTVHFLRGSCYMEMQAYEPARKDFVYALDHNYEDASLCAAQCSLTSFLTGNYELCVWYGEKAIEEPSDQVSLPDLYYYMGVSAMTIEKYEPAVTYYTKTAELDAKRQDAVYYRAVCYMALAKLDEAVADFTVLIDAEYEQSVCLYNRSICYLRKNNLYAARHDLERLIRLDEDEELVATASDLLRRTY